MKKIFKITSILVFIFIFPLVVKANSIYKINMDIYIDSNGTAHVTEVWSVNYSSDTELYKSYKNMGNSKIIEINKFKFTYDDFTFINTMSYGCINNSLNSKIVTQSSSSSSSSSSSGGHSSGGGGGSSFGSGSGGGGFR